MARNRWLKFFPVDWQADPALRRCSLAARGLWIECIAIMHQAEPYGHLLVDGEPPTIGDLTRIVGAPHPNQVRTLLDELRRARVFTEVPWPGLLGGCVGGTPGGQWGEHPEDTPEIPPTTPTRTPTTCIVSRRMMRDAQASDKARETGRRGGNPKLLGDKGGVNLPLKPRVKLEAEAEAEAEITPPNGGASSAKPDDAPAPAEEGPDARLPRQAFEIWNEEARQSGLPVHRTLPDKWRARLRVTLRDQFRNDLTKWRAYCQHLGRTPFMRGENDRGWKATLEFAIRQDSVEKQRAGFYGGLRNG